MIRVSIQKRISDSWLIPSAMPPLRSMTFRDASLSGATVKSTRGFGRAVSADADLVPAVAASSPACVVASIDGVIADVIPRTASIDGALEQEGEADLTLAGHIYFEFGSAVLVPRAAADLATVATQVREAGVPALDVVGDTDSVGSDADNLALSQARAASVVAALQPQLPGVTLTPDGRGETELVAEETTEDGQDDPVARALNRRVTTTRRLTCPTPLADAAMV